MLFMRTAFWVVQLKRLSLLLHQKVNKLLNKPSRGSSNSCCLNKCVDCVKKVMAWFSQCKRVSREKYVDGSRTVRRCTQFAVAGWRCKHPMKCTILDAINCLFAADAAAWQGAEEDRREACLGRGAVCCMRTCVPPTLTLLIPPSKQLALREILSTTSTGLQKSMKNTKLYEINQAQPSHPPQGYGTYPIITMTPCKHTCTPSTN